VELSTIIGAPAKVLSVLKSLPLWLLSGIALTLIIFRCIPALRGNIPVSTLPWFTLGSLLFAILSMLRLGSVLFEREEIQLQATKHREKNSLDRVYSPIYVLFLTCHVTTYSSTGAPFLRQRLSNALDHSLTIRRRRGAIRDALKAVFDKEIHTSGEVEYGGDFPRDQIKDIVLKNHVYADRRLLELVAWADRAQYEDPHGNGKLTDADLELYHHILNQYERLRKRYGT